MDTMTDETPRTPTTEAGRRLLATFETGNRTNNSYRAVILAIEAEARENADKDHASLCAEIERLRAALTTLGDVDYFAGVMQWDGWKVATRMRDFARAALEEPTE